MDVLPAREGELLVVPTGVTLPKVCLKCGGRHDIVRRKAPYTVGTAGRASAGVGGVIGVVFAQTMRGVDRVVAVLVFTVLIATASAVAWVMQRSATKVELALPLCASCDAAWTEGERQRTGILWGLGGSFVALAAGYALASTVLMAVGGLAFAIAIVVALVLQLPKRFVPALAVKPEAVRLKVAPAIADAVVERARRRAERRAAKDAEPAGEET